MSMERLRPECLKCLADKYLEKYPKNVSDKEKLTYMQQVLQLMAEAPRTDTAPVIVKKITEVYIQLFGEPQDEYSQVKWHFNEVMLKRQKELQKKIEEAEDSLMRAIQYAMIGNYIDFGVMKHVDEDYLTKLLEDASENSVSVAAYEALKQELTASRKLVYLTDNCGEIVLDKLLIRQIQKQFPQLAITVIVRGGDVLNDATMVDAKQIGLTDIVHVIGNGNDIAGTWMEALSEEAKTEMDSADVILAKGQANYETLNQCGRNIFYLFLCKCEMFAREFDVPKYTGMLVKEKF